MRLILVSILMIALSAHSDEVSKDLSTLGFIERDIPEVGSEQWKKANWKFPPHYVSNKNGLEVKEATQEEERSREIVFDTGTIKYIGIDKGEWGGGLYVNNVNKAEKPIFSENIKALIPIKNDLYIISGLAHMGYNQGAVHVIRDFNSPKEPERVALLPDAPQTVLLDKTRNALPVIIIAGFKSLMSFQPDDSFKIIKFNTFWSSLYPTSIIRYKDNYILGIRSGVAVVTPNRSRTKVRYFVPN